MVSYHPQNMALPESRSHSKFQLTQCPAGCQVTIGKLATDCRSSHCRSLSQILRWRAKLPSHSKTSREQSGLVIPMQLRGCVESGGFVRHRFPGPQDRVGSSQNRLLDGLEGKHWEKSSNPVRWQFVALQWSAILEDRSQSYSQGKCKQPSVKEHHQCFHAERREVFKTTV